jgi:hypothetical protein
METTKLISVIKTGLKFRNKPIFEVTKQHCKDGWSHKTETTTGQYTKYIDSNGKACYKRVYANLKSQK